MAFQAPFDIVGMRNQQMREDLAQQEQQQQYMGMISGALGDLASAYQQHETMKASVKSGEQMLKMFGPQLGIDSKILSSPEYKAMGVQGQAALHGNIWGSLGSLSNMRMAQSRIDQAPVIQTQRDNAATNRMYEQERLRREREAMNAPKTPPPITVPTGMRRFNNSNP